MKFLKLGSAIVLLLTLVGCAHPMVIAPNVAKLERPADAKPKIKANVGYYVNEARRSEEITTPGGGGDKVRTAPYRDVETGFYKMLTNVFDNVTILKKPDDTEMIAKNQISYIITTPQIVTTSSSSSMLTWPPTDFTVDLTCEVRDQNGKLVDTKRVVGKGKAEFAQFKTDYGLSGKLAMEDALLQLQRLLLDMPQPGAVAERAASQ